MSHKITLLKSLFVILLVLALSSVAFAIPPPPPAVPIDVPCIQTNGGVEICDSIDNNCDGSIDEGVCPSSDTSNDDGGSSSSSSRSSGGVFTLPPKVDDDVNDSQNNTPTLSSSDDSDKIKFVWNKETDDTSSASVNHQETSIVKIVSESHDGTFISSSSLTTDDDEVDTFENGSVIEHINFDFYTSSKSFKTINLEFKLNQATKDDVSSGNKEVKLAYKKDGSWEIIQTSYDPDTDIYGVTVEETSLDEVYLLASTSTQLPVNIPEARDEEPSNFKMPKIPIYAYIIAVGLLIAGIVGITIHHHKPKVNKAMHKVVNNVDPTIDKRIISYIDRKVDLNSSYEDIEKSLESVGWHEEGIKKHIEFYKDHNHKF